MAVIEQVCRAECLAAGLCVTVEPTKFIYAGGEESGAVVGLLNYPRFPKTKEALLDRANELAELLLSATHQQSVLIVAPDVTEWITNMDAP